MLKRQQSLLRATTLAETLVESSLTIVRVRELLKAAAWTELHALLGSLERAPALHELCAPEVERARAELRDCLLYTSPSPRDS